MTSAVCNVLLLAWETRETDEHPFNVFGMQEYKWRITVETEETVKTKLDF